MKRAFTLFAMLALAACATLPASGGPIRTDGMARLNESTRVGALVVTPRAVVEDSRCPINARCVWAGRAIVRTQIDGASRREITHMELGRPYITHGVGLQLTSVEPGKLAGSETDPAQYIFAYEGGR